MTRFRATLKSLVSSPAGPSNIFVRDWLQSKFRSLILMQSKVLVSLQFGVTATAADAAAAAAAAAAADAAVAADAADAATAAAACR